MLHPALAIAKTGLAAQDTQMSVVTNNLANVSTVGFKRSRANFEDALYQKVAQPGGSINASQVSPNGMMLGGGTNVVSTQKLFEQGNIVQTGNPLDLAISGQGFFQVSLPDGTTAYTRAGNLQIDETGRLVTPAGHVLQPEITIPQPAESISIGRDGTVSVLEPGNTTPTNVGQITLSNFTNLAGLEPIGENLFQETASSGQAATGQPTQDALGGLEQGAIESSNVNVVQELVDMIQSQRAYELNAKAIETIDSMLEFAVRTL